jgi:hypothetical protein
MLTLEILKKLQPNEIFAAGKSWDSSRYLNLTNTGKLLRWIAVRGGIHDWCIYAQDASWSIEEVKENGEKIYSESIIRSLVPCTDEAFKMYRY